MSILGYDPQKYYTGRAPIEAAAMGVGLSGDDVAFRCNLTTLAEQGSTLLMDDYSAGHISSAEAKQIIDALNAGLSTPEIRFYPGRSYRHLMVWKGGSDRLEMTPPHDITDKDIAGYLPKGEGADMIGSIMTRSREILKDHPVNKERIKNGKKPATSIWLWGQGRTPSFPTLRERFSVEGSIISAVDLVRGIGVCAGLTVVDVPGATGYLDTNYKGKGEYAIKALEKDDFVCVHVEAPDEASHEGRLSEKIKAIENFDELVVGPVLRRMRALAEFKLMVVTDHFTPVRLKTHTAGPVPFVVYRGEVESRALGFNEKDAKRTGIFRAEPEAFIRRFFSAR
jgi:2,3-bisphosphoglycerate-independent phosphoglycerate mutase